MIDTFSFMLTYLVNYYETLKNTKIMKIFIRQRRVLLNGITIDNDYNDFINQHF